MAVTTSACDARFKRVNSPRLASSLKTYDAKFPYYCPTRPHPQYSWQQMFCCWNLCGPVLKTYRTSA